MPRRAKRSQPSVEMAAKGKGTALGPLPLLQEVANAAVFAGSDRAGAMTAPS